MISPPEALRPLVPGLVALLLAFGPPACSSDRASPVDGGVGADTAANGDATATDATRPADGDGAGNLVQTAQGPVQGTLGVHYRSFLGIPYAAPPVGERRWQAPAPPASWTEPRDGSRFGPACPQLENALTTLPTGQDEDCLTLNVWTPWPLPGQAAPVMVWFHGGGFTNGGTAQALYNGQTLAEQSGTVLVTVNYRLGPLGFLAHPALGTGSGNCGIRDQQAALTWVRDNIAAFGGDPGQVTIFGESAGGISVCLHLIAPASQGLFQRAIQQSGPCIANTRTQPQAEAQGAELAQALSCSGEGAAVATCLRETSVDDILNALPLNAAIIFGEGVNWGPHADGTVIPETPGALFGRGAFAEVPLLLGTNRDEGTLFVWAGGLRLMTKPQYETVVNNTFGDDAAAVLAQYPADDYDSGAAALAELLGDLGFVCPTRQMARIVAGRSTVPAAYLYHFTREPSFSALPFLGAFHAAEIPFVFGTGAAMGGLTAEEQALSQAMIGYWTRFAATGDPSGGDAPQWAPYAAGSDSHQQLDLTIAAGSALKQAKCDFWDSLL